MKRLLNVALCMTLAFSAQAAIANTMMCGGTIIDDDELVPVLEADVLAACGSPTSKVDGQWVYEQPGQFVKVLEFDSDGNLESITDEPATE
jgi:hypothetical protein